MTKPSLCRLARFRQKADEAIAAPKVADPCPRGTFPCKPGSSRASAKGPSSPSLTPDERRRTVGEGHAPVVAVLLALAKKKGRRGHRCPQRARIMDPKPFPLQIASFLGTARGAIIAILDPEPAAWGEGHAPVGVVLLAARQKAFRGPPKGPSSPSWTLASRRVVMWAKALPRCGSTCCVS